MTKTRATKTRSTARRRTTRPLSADLAIIAILIGAMDANRHVSREEAWRAHHLIWSMRRFRNAPGEKIDRLIDTARQRMIDEGADAVLDLAARALPPRLRPSVFAAAIDLMLVDTRLEKSEREFVERLTSLLKVKPELAADVLRVLLIKNAV